MFGAHRDVAPLRTAREARGIGGTFAGGDPAVARTAPRQVGISGAVRTAAGPPS
jgi:hypothetical protein